jgi:hypothetical protein
LFRLFSPSWWRHAGYFQLYYLFTRHHAAIRFGPRSSPDYHYAPWKALRLLGRRVEFAVDRIDWAWNDATVVESVPGALNGDCTDISKSVVDRAMDRAFGYRAGIDPRTYKGAAVRKSEENTAHDGVLVECPLKPEPAYVYQRLIDNRVSADREVVDLRLVKVGDTFPVGYRKYRGANIRFVNFNTHVDLFDPRAEFSDDELRRLAEATNAMRLDVGEIDVLRDRDGTPYLIDVNKTPWGPPAGLSWLNGVNAMHRYARALEPMLSVRRSAAPAGRGRFARG